MRRTEDGGHDGYARVFGSSLGIVHAQRLEGRKTDGLMAAGHDGRAGGTSAKRWTMVLLGQSRSDRSDSQVGKSLGRGGAANWVRRLLDLVRPCGIELTRYGQLAGA
jgi:hypothetical protein